jgi:hypothetical protein
VGAALTTAGPTAGRLHWALYIYSADKRMCNLHVFSESPLNARELCRSVKVKRKGGYRKN